MHYNVQVCWEKYPGEIFTDSKYHRMHKWILDGGTDIVASSSPQVVPVPMSDESAIDPEEAFVASLSGCHMLFFLSIAAKEKFVVNSYEDNAEGIMEPEADGKMMMKEVILKPLTRFSGVHKPSEEQIKQMHELSHEKCFIANSIKSKITIIPLTGGNYD